ncbi:7038_t:CDS:1, partial [Cetraspora pellucida]
ISYVDVQSASKKQMFDLNELQVSNTLPKSTRSKLITTHQNISEETSKNFEASTSINITTLNSVDSDFQNSKRVKTEKTNENVDTTYSEDELHTNQSEENLDNLMKKDNEYERNTNRIRGHGKANKNRGQGTRSVKKTRNSKIINVISDNEN